MKNKNGLVTGLGILCLALMVVVGCTVVKEKKQAEAVPAYTEEETISSDVVVVDGVEYTPNTDIETVLFLGIDKEARTDFHNTPGLNGQSDSMNLLVMNKETKEATILQISRDTMVEIDIYSAMDDKLMTEPGQISLQYAYGDGEKRSCQLVKEKVSDLLYGADVDSYFALTLDGMVVAADKIGVELTVPEDYTYINPAFTQGAVLILDGELTEAYVRSRDFEALEANEERMERQAQYMSALMTKIKGIEDMNAYVSLYQELEPYMVTDMTAEEMMELAEYNLASETVEIPGEIKEIDGYAGLVVDNDKLKEIVLNLFYKAN